MTFQESFIQQTDGRGTIEITDKIQRIVTRSDIKTGLCHIFQHHTSASLIVCENADPDVRKDLETFMSGLAPDGDAMYQHQNEGPDDMPAHIRSVLTATSLTLPVSQGQCDLGIWQGIYLWEHRTAPNARRITVTVQ